MMDWFPIVFIVFKVLVLGTGMFFAVKWHHDQGEEERRAALRMGGKIAAIFVLLLLGAGVVTFVLSRMLGLDLGLS
ncbi:MULTISPECIES: hypothetical protein [Rhizobium]